MAINMSSQNWLQQKFQVWWVLIAYSTIQSGFLSILFVYFVKNNLNFGLVLLAEGLGYGLSAIILLSKNRFTTQRGMQFGLLLVLCGLPLLLAPFAPLYILFPYTLLKVTGGIMFYVPYNILFFENTHREKKLQRMAVYWGIGSAVSVLAPMTGGWIFARFGLAVFIVVSLLILLTGIGLTWLVKKQTYPYKTAELIVHIKGFRLVSMIDGALQSASGLLISLYLLTFIKNEFNFGQILSVIALVSVLLSLQLAKVSDRTKKRLEFIWPLSFGIGVIMISLYFVHTLWIAVILIVGYQFLSSLFNPIRSNILLDNVDHAPITWISRELYLNIGRTFVLFLLAFVVYSGHLREAFFVMASLFFVFPFILLFKGVYGNH